MEIKTKNNAKLNIIAVGASAGGLEALQEFLSHLPSLPNSSIIIAQHLSPTHKSLLVELLSKQTSLSVSEAKHGMPLTPDTVYITPPDKEISIHNNTIQLEKPSSLIGPKPSVDVLFQSLKNISNQKVIAVVLSGTGSDGSKGMAELNDKNVLKLVQEPQSAKYDGMPQAVIQANRNVIQLIPSAMGRYILGFINEKKQVLKAASKEHIKTNFEKVLLLLSKHTGHDFSNYKYATLERRLEKRMQLLHIATIEKYIAYIKDQSNELNELFNMVLIGVTQFFRDQEAFNALELQLTEICKIKHENESFRVWIPGCSSGEEAYSIAILIEEISRKTGKKFNTQIFASDIDERAIAHARKATYQSSSVEGLPIEIIDNYFIRKGNDFEVIKNIRSKVLFSKHDVTQNPPFMRLDLISCRNLLIYFNTSLQQQVFPVFHYALNNNGTLFLGKSESIGLFTDLFTPIDNKNKIYVRKHGGSIHNIRFSSFKPQLQQQLKKEKQILKKSDLSLSERIKETIFNTFDHPYVIINSDFSIQEVSGDVRLFMSLSQGNIQVNLLKMVNPELQIELRSLLVKVFKENEIKKSSIKAFHLFEKKYYVRIIAKPLLFNNSSQDLYMVIFEQLEIEDFIDKSNVVNLESANHIKINELETELNTTKEHLQTYIEEIETGNEELQSLNEELQSTNEELQSSNEELETTNEELQSTNEEIQIAYAELRTIHEDLEAKDALLRKNEANTRALLNNNLQAFILIDNQYQIIDFNDKAASLIQFLSYKNLTKASSFFEYLPNDDIDTFLNQINHIQQNHHLQSHWEFQFNEKNTKNVKTFQIHINAVVAYNSHQPEFYTIGWLDITDKKNAEVQLLLANNRLEKLLNSQTSYVLRTDLRGRHTYWNHVFEENYGWVYKDKGIKGSDSLLSICKHDHHKAFEAVEECLKSPGKVVQVELDKPARNGNIRTTLWDFVCLTDEVGNPFEIQCIGIEVTMLKQLRESERMLNEAQKIAKLGHWNFDFENNHLTWSEGLYDVFDVDRKSFRDTHDSFLHLVDEADKERVLATSKKAQETGQPFHIQYQITTPKDEKRTVEEYGYAEKDENGKIIRLFGTAQNISDRIKTEQELINAQRIFNYASDMLCIANFNGYFETVNPAWTSTLGYTRDELISKPFIEFVHPEDVADTLDEAHKVHNGDGSVSFENRYICKDGSVKWLAWKSFPFVNEKKIYAVVRDITESKKIEQQLRENEERFRQIVENNQAVIWEIDNNGLYTYLSPKATEIWGFKVEDVVHKKHFYELAPPEEIKKVREEGLKLINENIIFSNFKNKVRKPDGKIITVLTNGAPFYDDKGNKKGYRGSDIDITEKLNAELEAKQTADLLNKLANQVPGMVYQFKLRPDGTNCFPYASRQIENIYWLDSEDVKSDGTPLFNATYENDKALVVQAIEKSAKELSLFHVEYRVRNPYSNNLEWRQSTSMPEKLEDGSIIWHGIINDITERKEKELELIKLKTAIEQSPLNIVITDIKGDIEYVNPHFEIATGYTKEEAIGQNPRILKSGVQSLEFYQKMWQELTNGKIWKGEICNKKKSGQLYWESAIITPIKNESDKIVNYIAVKEDITEKRKITEEIEKFKLIAEKAVYGMAMADMEGNFTYCNPFYAHIHGYEPHELIGKSLRVFHNQKQLIQVDSLIEEIQSKGNFKPVMVWHSHKNGKVFPMFMSGILLYDSSGNAYQMAATAIDMTEYYSTQALLKESQLYHKALLEAQPDTLFVVNNEFVIVDFKASDEDLYVKPEFFIQKDFRTIMPKMVADIIEKMVVDTFISNQLQEAQYELEIDHKKRYFNARSVTFGKDKVIIMTRDVTSLIENLNQIKKLLEIEENHNKRLTDFTHIVSHNLRSHTANMQGVFNLVEMEEPQLLQDGFIAMIKKSADNLTETLSNLNEVLDITRNPESKYSHVNIGKSIERAINSVIQLANDKAIKIINNIDFNTLPEIYAIPAFVDSILLNLLTNAIKFSSPIRSSYIKISSIVIHQYLCIKVQDNGLGIDVKKHGNEIFGMYKTFHKNTDSKGLGLFITKNQIDAMKGKISVKSRPDKGATFRVCFLLNKE